MIKTSAKKDSKKNLAFTWLFKLHIYIGLYCSVYFTILGLTGLNFQHHFLDQEPQILKEYTKEFQIDSSLNRSKLIHTTIAELDIYGDIIWWKVWENKTNKELHFELIRPGKKHIITVFKEANNIDVQEINMGIARVLGGLHYGTAGDPNSFLYKVWRGYVHSVAILSLFLIISSIYFWLKKSIKHKHQWIVVIASASISIILILYVWLVG